jgi:hypothetical protein
VTLDFSFIFARLSGDGKINVMESKSRVGVTHRAA